MRGRGWRLAVGVCVSQGGLNWEHIKYWPVLAAGIAYAYGAPGEVGAHDCHVVPLCMLCQLHGGHTSTRRMSRRGGYVGSGQSKAAAGGRMEGGTTRHGLLGITGQMKAVRDRTKGARPVQ